MFFTVLVVGWPMIASSGFDIMILVTVARVDDPAAGEEYTIISCSVLLVTR